MDTGVHIPEESTHFRAAYTDSVYSNAQNAPTNLIGTGTSRLNPTDSDVPEIGDELAVARALSELAHQLLHAAAEDIAGVPHDRVKLIR